MSENDPWAGLLDPDEKILWQGHPTPGVRFDLSQPMSVVIGLFFMGFSIFWMKTAAMAGGYFWMFGLLFFGIGFYNAIGVHFWKSFLRGQTHYTLTDKRGFIATNTLGRKTLASYPITAESDVTLSEGTRTSVYFHNKVKRSKNGTYTVPIGFEDIHDAREVLSLIRQVQQDRAREVSS